MKKIWDNFREWFFYKTISRNTKLAILKIAKLLCEKYTCYGMCTCIHIAIEIILSKPTFTTKLNKLFPEFNREYLGGDIIYGSFWWHPCDRTSRLKAFDKLIKLYE